MSNTHTKFNPEGVKGKTAKPPHKIFNFMKRDIWIVAIKVKHVETQIELEPWTWMGMARCRFIAERVAVATYENKVFDGWKRRVCNKFGLTATQLDDMIAADVVTKPNDIFDVKIAGAFKAECEPLDWD